MQPLHELYLILIALIFTSEIRFSLKSWLHLIFFFDILRPFFWQGRFRSNPDPKTTDTRPHDLKSETRYRYQTNCLNKVWSEFIQKWHKKLARKAWKDEAKIPYYFKHRTFSKDFKSKIVWFTYKYTEFLLYIKLDKISQI